MGNPRTKRIVEELVAAADIRIDGDRPFDLKVHDERLYDRILASGSLGFGEAYMDGWWDCDAIDEMIARVFRADVRRRLRWNWSTVCHAVRSRFRNLQAVGRAFQIGRHHYDIGNDLYEAMLGETLAYTCAYWKDASTLDEAQRAKMDLVCRKVGLERGIRVLELGCGWGSFACYAARTYGVEVVGYTVSKEQAELGAERAEGLPVKLHLADYRGATGKYDRVISIGIMEHVGYRNYRMYMEVADRCLKKDGVAFVHTIGGNTSGTSLEPWMNKYIFPNAMLPSVAQLGRAMEGLFVLEDWHNIGPDYDRTLMAWHANLERAWPRLADKYGERFRRMWRYYLLSCAGGFRARHNQLWQIVLTRERDCRPQPDCRKT